MLNIDYDFMSELKFIKSSTYINDIFLIFTIYKKFFNEVLSQTPLEYKNYVENFLSNSFRYVCYMIENAYKKESNCTDFFKEYFAFVQRNPYIKSSKIGFLDEISNKYKENLDVYIENASYADYLDTKIFEENNILNFYTRYKLLQDADSYRDTLIQNIDESYEKEEASKIKNYIIYYYGQQIHNYLSFCIELKTEDKDIIQGFIPTMMVKIKDVLKEEINKNNLNLSNLKTERDKSLLSQYDEKQSKVYTLERIYDICGFNNEERPVTLDKMKEVSYLLGVNLLESAVLLKEMPSYTLYKVNKLLEENGVEAVADPGGSRTYTGFI